jgi:hypothetical protein
VSADERRQQLLDMLDDAHACGDEDKVKEFQGDLEKEFPCLSKGEQDT